MSRFITTKANFTIRRKHKKASGSTIYENDYTTITPLPNAFKNEYVIGDSNFKFTTRFGINSQKKHSRGKFIPNPAGEGDAWTLDTMPVSAISNETKIRLKPDYNSLKDFACYGSANKLVQGTINGVIMDFPAELYFSDEELSFYAADSGNAGYSTNEVNEEMTHGYVLYNEYGIDVTSTNIQPGSVYNQLRYFCLCGSSYVFIDESGDTHDFVSFSSSGMALGECYQGANVEVDNIARAMLTFESGITIEITVFKDYTDGAIYYLYADGSLMGGHIRPKKQIVEQYFADIDDFTAVLLNRVSNPIYCATLQTPKETETGFVYDVVNYIWPSLNGGYNPDLTGPYYSYVESLIGLADFYDEYFSDHMWRSLTHEAIKTLDWTYVSNTADGTDEMETIDTSRIEPIVKIYGRQFDDLKRYADGIKTVNTITYSQRSNMPDYTLIDALENSGWETKTLNITSDKDVKTEALYPALSTGYTAPDASNEFIRRLKLNSRYLISTKGTRKGLDAVLAMFGFTPDEYDIHEYVYVASADGSYTRFCQSTSGLPLDSMPLYPLAKDVSTINRYKINYDINDPYGEYCGIPVTEIGYFVNDGESGETLDYSYVVPWFSQGKKYDDGLYFQMNGGWGNRKTKKIDLEIASGITEITEADGVVLYDETQTRLKFAMDFDELLQQAAISSKTSDVFYVTDISEMMTRYSYGPDESGMTDYSHYFILENPELYQFMGYAYSGTASDSYGWRNVKESEIQTKTGAGSLVLYLESIKDDTTGNNPHIGDGTYDGGKAYLDSMSNIFGYSLENQNFIGIDDDTCAAVAEYIFNLTKREDDRKCWFFSDDYNETSGKTDGETITLLEADITSGKCLDPEAIIELVDALGEGPENKNTIPEIGSSATKYFETVSGINYDEVYRRISHLIPFNPEDGGTTGEAAANSIINVKELAVNFNLPVEFKDDMMDYINDTVIPYLTQMIPSTTILRWSFDGDNIFTEKGLMVEGLFEQVPDCLPLSVTGSFDQEETDKGIGVIGDFYQEETDRGIKVEGKLTQVIE